MKCSAANIARLSSITLSMRFMRLTGAERCPSEPGGVCSRSKGHCHHDDGVRGDREFIAQPIVRPIPNVAYTGKVLEFDSTMTSAAECIGCTSHEALAVGDHVGLCDRRTGDDNPHAARRLEAARRGRSAATVVVAIGDPRSLGGLGEGDAIGLVVVAQPRVRYCATVLLPFGENQPAGTLGNAEQHQHRQDAEQRQQDIIATRQPIWHG